MGIKCAMHLEIWLPKSLATYHATIHGLFPRTWKMTVVFLNIISAIPHAGGTGEIGETGNTGEVQISLERINGFPQHQMHAVLTC